jgi:hypothetical protein
MKTEPAHECHVTFNNDLLFSSCSVFLRDILLFLEGSEDDVLPYSCDIGDSVK